MLRPLLAARRSRAFFLLLAALTSLLLAPSPDARAQTAPEGGDGEPVTVVVGGANPAWGIPAPNATSPAERARRVVFDQFSKKYPNIRLQRYSSLRIQGQAAESGILLAFAGGTAPDVVYVNFRQLRNYVTQGFLRPLDDLIAQNPDVMDRVQPRIKQELYVDNSIYTIPYAQYVQALYYRKDLFRAAGLNPNKPPTDWNQFYEYAKALTDHEKGQWGFIFAQGTESYWWINFLWQAGGEVALPDPKSGLHLAAFNSQPGVEALEFYRKLLIGEWTDASGKKRIGVATRSTTLRQDISAGKIGMWFAYQSDDVANMNQYDLNPSLLGVAIMPKGPSGITANEINAGMWGINSAVKDPKKLAACWEFIRYMASEEAAQIRTTAYVENGLAQLVNPNELEKWGYSEFITPAQRPWMEANESLFKTGKPEPNGPNMAFIYQLMNEPLDQSILYPERDAKQILDTAVEKINTKLLNYTPPEEMQRKRLIAWGIFAVVATAIAGFIAMNIGRALRDGARRRAAQASGGYATPLPGSVAARLPLRTHLSAWAFMAPAVLSVAVWAYFPLLRGMLMAFQEYRILGGSHWIGLDNFIEAVGQETFRIGLINAFYFTIWLLGLGFFLPIIIALLLNEIPWGKVLFRVLYYLPAVTTSIVVAMLWAQFWKIDGLANYLLGFFGVEPQKWLQDPNQAMFAVVLPLVWAGAGPGSVIYLAALQSIPDEMYEAADIDGAGFFSKIFRITLPTLSPLIIINLVGATVTAFKVMEPILVQTGGGPDNATYTIGLEIWYNAFMYLKFGYATAAAILMAALLIGLTMYQLRVLQNVRFAAGNR
jgi:ABC-type sugar transport systems, permease components